MAKAATPDDILNSLHVEIHQSRDLVCIFVLSMASRCGQIGHIRGQHRCPSWHAVLAGAMHEVHCGYVRDRELPVRSWNMYLSFQAILSRLARTLTMLDRSQPTRLSAIFRPT
jgi:hypothetical protein